MDIEEVQKLESLEDMIKEHTNTLKDLLYQERDAHIVLLKVQADITVYKNSMKQLTGERDSLKKVMSIIPR